MANTIPQHGAPTQQSTQGGTSGQTQSGQSGLVDKLADTAEQKAAKAIERVKGTVQSTRERAESGIQSQHEMISGRIRGVGKALRLGGESIEGNEHIASLLNLAGDRIDRLAEYVDNASPRTVARDVERFAREKPAWFFGGAFLAGLALGRFAKSSAESASGRTDGMRMTGDEYPDYPTGRGYPQTMGGASATYSGGSPYAGGTSPGSGYSGYTSSGTATSGGYTGSTGSSRTTGGSGYTGGTSSSGSGGTLSGTGAGYGGSSSGAGYSGSGASGSTASPSSTSASTTTSSTGTARNGNGGTSSNNGTSGAGRS